MATEKVIKIVVDKKGADKNIKELNKNLEQSDKNIKGLSNQLDKMSGGAVSAFNSLKTGVLGAVKGFKTLRVAIAATGIGLLITSILAVKEAFTSSEEGQNKFAKILGIIGSVVGNLSDVLSDLGMKIISVFENPKKSLQDFGNLIKDNIVTRFKGLLNLIPNLGKAIGLLFKGEFKEAGKVAADSVGQVALGVESITDNLIEANKALNEFTEEAVKDAKIAGQIADQRAKADKVERKLLVDRANANRKIAELRLKAEQRDKFSAKERIKFLKEASDLEENITNKEIQAARLRFNAKVKENSLSKSTKEDLDEEARLKANLINLETKKLNLSKLLESKIQSVTREQQALDKAEQDRKQKELDDAEKSRIEKANKDAKNEADRLQKIKDIQDEFKKKREDEEAQTEIEKLELEKERKLLELEELKATEQEKADIIKYYNEKISEEKIQQKEKEKQVLESLEESFVNNSINLLIMLAGRGSKIGKGLAVANIVRKQIESASESLSSLTAANAKAVAASPLTGGQPFVGINTATTLSGIALNAATAGKSISDILSEKKTVSSSYGGSQGGASAPSFNLVQGTGSNQIAETISQEQRPVQAFVVGSQVTSQQELDRQRNDISSI